MTPIYADVGASVGEQRGAAMTIRADQFYGKVMVTAMREYLEMRRASNQGPATPREIYDATVAGGFKFDTDNELNRITGIRTALRKSSSIFHRLPNNEYGLLAWYPKAKAPSPEEEDDAPSKKAKGTVKKAPRATRLRAKKPAKVAVPRPAREETKKPGGAIGTEFDTFALLSYG